MAKMSVSFVKASGKTSIKHNNREKEVPHANKEFERENVYLRQDKIQDIYEREFGEALKKYNEKQTRNDRKIDNYYSHIRKSKKHETQFEFIVQVGDMNDYQTNEDWNQGKEMLEKWFEEFEQENPSLKVYNAVVHMDEATPHLHINVVPVATGYKNGLEKQASFDKALRNQGEEGQNNKARFQSWRDKQIDRMETLMHERGIERKKVGTNDIKNYHEFKEIKQLQAEVKNLETVLANKKQELAVVVAETEVKVNFEPEKEVEAVKVDSDKKWPWGKPIPKTEYQETGNVILPEKTYDSLVKSATMTYGLKARIKSILETDYAKENESLKNEVTRLKEKNNYLVNDYNDLVDENTRLENMVKNLTEEIVVIYDRTRNLLKEHTPDLQTFKSLFKSLVRDIKEKAPMGNFERLNKQEQKRDRGMSR